MSVGHVKDLSQAEDRKRLLSGEGRNMKKSVKSLVFCHELPSSGSSNSYVSSCASPGTSGSESENDESVRWQAHAFWLRQTKDFKCASLSKSSPSYSKLEAVTHELRTQRNQVTAANLAAALAIISTKHTAHSTAHFGVRLSAEGVSLPFRADASANLMVREFQRSCAVTILEAGIYEQFVQDALPDVYSSQLSTVLDLSSFNDMTTSSTKISRISASAPKEQTQTFICLDWVQDKLALSCQYNPASMSRLDAQRLLWRLDQVLSQFETNLDLFVKQISCLSANEFEQMSQWNELSAVPETLNVHENIDIWAQRQPQADALYAWDRNLTYAELEDMSSKLGNYLVQQLAVRSEQIVPLCIPRSALAVVAMIGVMKAGAAFIPLDPVNPRERNAGIVMQAEATVVLTSSQIQLDVEGEITISWEFLEQLSACPMFLLPSVEPRRLAYIIFTSGSTGKPKGVMIEHGSLSISLKSHGGVIYDQNPRSRVLQFASLAFDASMTEHLAPLTNGACVCIPDQETRMDGIIDFINESGVNWAFFTPSFFKLIEPEDVPQLHTVVLGGEAITDDCIDKWSSKIKLINGYGPSETTIVATACVVDPQTRCRASIGKGLACKTWIADVNDHNQLVPIGETGELLIQGPTVGRGYLNDETKTEAAFVRTPLWGQQTDGERYKRVYKTGDLVRYDEDGSLIYLGRKDTQVKVRGQRVELAEVEHHMSAILGIQHAAAFVPKIGFYKGRLVTILTCVADRSTTESQGSDVRLVQGAPAQNAQVTVQQSRTTLSERVPPYMVPDVWLAIQQMPFSVSGKVDRVVLANFLNEINEDVLSREVIDLDLAGRQDTEPANKVEGIIQEAWAHVLGLQLSSVALDCSFHSLGGDSIAAMRVLGKCRARNVNISTKTLLLGGSIRSIAAQANQNLSASSQSVDIDTSSSSLSPIQRLYMQHKPSTPHFFNQSRTVRFKQSFDVQTVGQALIEVVKRHSMLHSQLHRLENGKYVQRGLKMRETPILIRQHKAFWEVEVLSAIESSQTLVDIEKGVVVVADVFCDDDDSVEMLSLAVSHLAVDIVSWNIIFEDLQDFLTNGRFLASCSLPFMMWCKDQARQVETQWKFQRTLPYQRSSEAAGFWNVSKLDNVYGNTIKKQFRVDSGRSSQLMELVNSSSRLNQVDLFLACLFEGFAKAFPDRSLPTINNEGHGREPWTAAQDISRTVGWFTTLTPLVLGESSDGDVWRTARRICHTRSKIPNGGMPSFATQMNDADQPLETMEVVFNYMGVVRSENDDGAVFEEVAELSGDSGDCASPNMSRFSIFEISAEIRQGQIHFTFVWPQMIHLSSQAEQWVQECKSALMSAATPSPNQIISIPQCDVSRMPLDLDYTQSILIQSETILADSAKISMLLPVSTIQQAMLQAQDVRDHVYQTRLALRIREMRGRVDCAKLSGSWKAIVARHSILRTVFVRIPASHPCFYQVVLESVEPQIQHVVDSALFANPLTLSKAQWREYEPQHKLNIIEDSSGSVIVLLECSHALTDHASLQILFDEWSKHYSGAKLGIETFPYSEIVDYQQSSSGEGISWWHRLFGKSPSGVLKAAQSTQPQESLQLRTAVQTPPELVSSMRNFCQEQSVTPALVFQLAWAFVLQRHLGVSAVAFGSVVAGRDIDVTGIEKVVGPCLNFVTSVVSLEPESTIKRCLEEMQVQFLASLKYQHQYVSSIGASAPVTMDVNTMINFRRHTNAGEAFDSGTVDFQPVVESDPFDYAVVVEIDHYASGNFEIVLSHWSDIIPEEFACHLGTEYMEITNGIITGVGDKSRAFMSVQQQKEGEQV